ncbi:hypothetical protein SDC9_206196 [bioreactor metagenome]|uniref:Uncharacterized protein n=1 Tax=bioreactor metagenome TaxID=1076179 RepID=A0A645J4D0_9ZZZZ
MVARKIAPAGKGLSGVPACDSMAGLTNRMYAMAKKVVKPAMTSVDTLVLFSLSLKNFSISTSHQELINLPQDKPNQQRETHDRHIIASQ